MCFLNEFLDNVNNDFKDKEYKISNIAERNIITIVNKLELSHDFYIKHNMHAGEWKLNAMINNKNLIKKLDRSKRYPLNRKFSHVPFNN